MSEFGLEIAFALLRSTAVAAAALLLAGALGRRSPRSGVIVLASAGLLLIGLAILPLVALVPRPPAAQRGGKAVPVPGAPVMVAADSFDRMRIRIPLAEPSSGGSGVLAVLPVLYGIFAAASLGRLACDWRAIRRLRRRGNPVLDFRVADLARALAAERDWCRPLEIREVPEVDLAAVAGTFRPTVHLAPGWREWSNAELRAVLAHEIAHVVHRDYALLVLARLAQAANALQPLMVVLVERLRWLQERAADQSAADAPATRRPYIAALAQLALRRAALPAAVANPLSPSAGDRLIRRVQMLMEDGEARGSHRFLRTASVALLACLSLLAGYVGGRMKFASDDRAERAERAEREQSPWEIRYRESPGHSGYYLAPKAKKPYADHKIAPGDVLGVHIGGVLGGKNENPPIHVPRDSRENYAVGYPLTVNERGELDLPYIDPVKVEGLTTGEALKKIFAIYSDKKILVPEFAQIYIALIKPFDPAK